MYSLTQLYRIGHGPSSSHTMGPARAVAAVKEKYPDANEFKITLYASLAKTGKGHLTDAVIKNVLAPIKTEIVFNNDVSEENLDHPCAMDITALKDGREISTARVYSVGGGAIRFADQTKGAAKDNNEGTETYPHKNFEEIKEYCKENGLRIYQYVEKFEGPQIKEHLLEVYKTMKDEINRGLNTDGVLAGGLNVQRRAKQLYGQFNANESTETRENRMVASYAFAASEENAGGGIIVTAPTCGSCGIVPAVLYYYQNKYGLTDEIVCRGLATGGVIGNIVKTNASISGAECGCQAEVGTACCMAAAALGEIMGLSLDQIEYSAEISMEHMLGLTCDPIGGLVQIPCIERNAVAAMRAINAVSLATFLTDSRKISFDMVVKTMYETGRDMNCRYRETSEGGLAKSWKK